MQLAALSVAAFLSVDDLLNAHTPMHSINSTVIIAISEYPTRLTETYFGLGLGFATMLSFLGETHFLSDLWPQLHLKCFFLFFKISNTYSQTGK